MHRTLLTALAIGPLACSTGLDVDAPENGIQLRMEPAEVGPGKEVLLCSYLRPLATDLYVRAIDFHQTRGGHHVALFTSNTLKASGTTACKDPNTAEGSAEMADWRPVSAGINAVDTKLPPGIALKVPAGKQLMLQSHFVNVSREPMEAESVANLFAFEGTPSTMADYLSFNEITAMKLPLGASSVTRECSFDHEINVLTLLGHTHQYGTLYKLELQDLAGEWTTLYDEHEGDVLRDTPPVKTWPLEAPLVVKPGQKWRYTCAWNNTTDHELRWPEEMCAAFMTYYPSKGFLLCNDGQVGTLE